jgi:DNA-binding FadR family transcriptional regulator
MDNHLAFIDADVEFHCLISAASGNILFDRLCSMYAPLLGASFALQVRITSRSRLETETLPRHTAVYRAIAARDPGVARRAMETLITGSTQDVGMIVSDQHIDAD